MTRALALALGLLAFAHAGAQSPSPSASPRASASPQSSASPAVAAAGVPFSLAPSGAVILGRVEVQEPPPPASATPPLGASSRDDDSPLTNVVIYLKGFPAGTTFPPPATEGRLIQRKKRFVPYILPVQVGSTVRFPNEDDIFHNVFSLTKPAFNIGRYPKGPGKTVTFGKEGRVRVFCDIHSFMKSNILVLPGPHFTLPSTNGTFRLENVPSGSYWISAWHDRIPETQKPVTVKPGETVTVDFLVKP